jgi:glucan 1,3-beta-glucosidase
VLEKWLTPSVFGDLPARDEYTLCEQLGDEAASVLKLHRDNFITEADFAWMAAHGLNAVRLPVGYWVFGDEPPFVSCVEYVDKAFDWAEAHGLKILLDLHGAPGSQNGRDHSGRIGDMAWSAPENVQKSLDIIEKIAQRYKGSESLLGIELLNEPSWRNKHRRLRQYYEAGYERVRKHCGTNVAVVVADAFHPTRWQRLMQSAKYQNKMLDIHLYQLFSWRDKRLSLKSHIGKVNGSWRRLLRKVSAGLPVIIGEWSISLVPATFKGYAQAEKDAALRAYGSMQLMVFETTQGWFYWTYKTEKGGAWSYRHCVGRGWLPDRYESKP